MKNDSVTSLLTNLREDTFRKSKPFSADIEEANKVILNPFLTDAEKSDALSRWLHRYQPCLFGRIAAGERMHYCILSTSDLYSSDTDIKTKITSELLLWKRRCALNEKPEHGFMLLVADERVCRAAPDDNLRRFATRIRDLWGCRVDQSEHGNDIAWESTYLKDPKRNDFAVFTFSLDYFGSQGDQRWWHDHRVPGGIAFTANSLGHMVRYREWYENRADQTEWGLKTAMLTVEKAANVAPWGKAIWLQPLKNGQPLVESNPLVCPFADKNSLKSELQDKDWSHYRGWLSTDHSIRWDEFFRTEEGRPRGVKEWNQDLTYIYGTSQEDWAMFMGAIHITEDELYAIIGKPKAWPILSFQEAPTPAASPDRETALQLLSSLREKWPFDHSNLDQ